LTKNPEVM